MSRASAFKKIVDKLGNSVKHSKSESDAFHKALSDARGSDKRINDYTHLYSPEEYAQMKTFLAPDGKSGFAIKPDGDIVSAFNSVKGGGRLDDIMRTALSEGGTKLDAFDKLPTESKGLPDLYSKYGFKQVKREPNWTKGAPDVVYMEHPSAKKIKEIDTPEKAVALKGKEREEYLKALDDVYGSQSRRAKDMGFGDETFYHGTKADIDRFDLNKVGEGSGVSESGKAVWLSDDPKVAEEFSRIASNNFDFMNNPRWKQLDAKISKAHRGEGKISDAEIKEWSDIMADYGTRGSNIIPVKARSNPEIKNDYSQLDAFRRGKILDRSDDGSVLFKGLKDSPTGRESNVLATKNPSEIRSTNAAFDPRFKDSDLILASRAGVLGAGIGAATLGGNSEAEAANPKRIEELTKYLKDNPEMAQNFFNKFKYFNKEARDLQNKIPPSDKFEDLMSDRIIRDQSKAPELVKEIENKRELAFDHLDALKQSGYDVVHKRGQRGRTDKPFEEKIKMVNPETGKQLKLAETEKSTFGKILHGLGAPQRKAFSSVAEKLGVESNPEDSEETSRNIIQNLADRAGLPEDSSLVNAGKALGVAGMEVFADPVNAIPFAGLGKMGMKAINKVDPTMFNRLKKMFKDNPKRFEDAVSGNPELEKSLDKLKTVSPVDSSSKITKLRDDAGYGAVGTFDKLEDFLKGKK